MRVSCAVRSLLTAVAAVAALLPLAGCGSLIVIAPEAEALERRSGFAWESMTVEGYDIFLEAGPVAADQRGTIADAAQRGRRQVLRYLDLEGDVPTVSLFVVADRSRLAALIGRETSGTGFYETDVLCIVSDGDTLSLITHELLHVVAMNAWGVPERWINEGAAVDADTMLRGVDVHASCRRLDERGELPALRDLIRRFDRYPSSISYRAAGSFVRWLREAHGHAALRSTWSGGAAALPEVTGMDLDAIEAAWLSAIDAAPVG